MTFSKISVKKEQPWNRSWGESNVENNSWYISGIKLWYIFCVFFNVLLICISLPTPHPHYFIGTDKVVKNKEIM